MPLVGGIGNSMGNTSVVPVADFREWVRSTWRVTLAAAVMSTLGALVLATLVAYFARSSSRGSSGGRNPLVGEIPASPTSGTGLLLVLGLIFIISSVATSGIHRIESLVLRRHLRNFSDKAPASVLSLTSLFVRERILARSWINMLTASVQPVVLTIIVLILLPKAWPLWLIFVSCTLLVASAHWKAARQACAQFIAIKQRIRSAHQKDSSDSKADADPLEERAQMQHAYYERDAKALRLPPRLALLFTTSLVGAFCVPVAMEIDAPQTGIALIVLFLLHQRGIEFLMAIGRFSWGLTFWQSPTALGLGGEEDE